MPDVPPFEAFVNLYGFLTRADLTRANLTGARGDRWTRLPAGWAVNDAGLIVRESSGA